MEFTGNQLVTSESVICASAKEDVSFVEEEHGVPKAAKFKSAVECFLHICWVRSKNAGTD